MNFGTPARTSAALIALVCWAGLVIQCVATRALASSLLNTLWIVAGYFTILTNLLVAVVFTAAAINRTILRSPTILAGTMLSILLVGVIYGLLLHGLVELSGGSAVANILLHMVSPILVPLFWIAFVPKGRLSPRDPLLWAVFPLAYLPYALARGAATGRYAYPFINLPTLGWPRVLLNATLIAAVFLLAGSALVWLDRRLGRSLAR